MATPRNGAGSSHRRDANASTRDERASVPGMGMNLSYEMR